MDLWVTYTFYINEKEISVAAKDCETAKIKADKKYKQLFVNLQGGKNAE